MRELLLCFIFALIVGSIINSMQQKPPDSSHGSKQASPNNISQRDFPDFASFPSIDNTNFDTLVLKSEKPVFVECYVPNNLACDQMLPLVAAVGKEHQNSINMAKLNVMDNAALAHRYDIGTVPTFLLFNQGTLAGRLAGIMPQDRLESLIAPQLSSASR